MAEYTIGLWDILTRAGTDLSILDNLTEASKSEVFGNLINYIDQKFRDQFALGFALHFRNDEIGFETEQDWRFALAEKMVNGGDWINEMYSYIDKQIFSQYSVTESDGSHIENESVETHDATISNQTESSSTAGDIKNNTSGTRTGTRNDESSDEDTSSTNNTSNDSRKSSDNETHHDSEVSNGDESAKANETRELSTESDGTKSGTTTRTDNLTSTNEYDSKTKHRSETVQREISDNGSEDGTTSTQKATQTMTRDPSGLIETNTPNTKHSDLYSATPQGQLSDVEEGKYLTEARFTTDTGSNQKTYQGSESTTTSFDGPDSETRHGENNRHTTETTSHVKPSVVIGDDDPNDAQDAHTGTDTVKNTGTQGSVQT